MTTQQPQGRKISVLAHDRVCSYEHLRDCRQFACIFQVFRRTLYIGRIGRIRLFKLNDLDNNKLKNRRSAQVYMRVCQLNLIPPTGKFY